MLVQVGNIAAEGRDVVVDGMTFSSRQVRTAFASSAAAAGARFHLLWLDVPVAVARNRVASDPGHPAADRVPALVAAVADRFEVVENCALRLDGNLAPAELQQRASAFLDRYLRRIHS